VLSMACFTTCSLFRVVSLNSPVVWSTYPCVVVVVVMVLDFEVVCVCSRLAACCSNVRVSSSLSSARSSTSMRSAIETLDETSESATPSRNGVAFTEKMMCVGSVFLPIARGSVRLIVRPL